MFWDVLQGGGDILLQWRLRAVTLSYGALNRIPSVVVGLLCASVISGCARTMLFTKADMSRFAVDNYECTQAASYPAVSIAGNVGFTKLKVDPRLLQMCLEARGYTRTK